MPDKELKWSDARRILAVEMHQKGIDLTQIMEVVDAGRSTVYEWIQRAELEGIDSLVRSYTPRARKLDDASRERLKEMLDQGALAYGYEDARWTATRVQELLREEFEVSYHIATIAALLHELGYSWQKPETREPRRDEQAIETWVKQTWPEVKKKSS